MARYFAMVLGGPELPHSDPDNSTSSGLISTQPDFSGGQTLRESSWSGGLRPESLPPDDEEYTRRVFARHIGETAGAGGVST